MTSRLDSIINTPMKKSSTTQQVFKLNLVTRLSLSVKLNAFELIKELFKNTAPI